MEIASPRPRCLPLQRRLGPLLAAQSLGALNDNIFKTTLNVLVAYGYWRDFSGSPGVLASAAAALFTLPFILFASYGAQLADRVDKRIILIGLKVAEVCIVLLASLSLLTHSIGGSMLCLFLLGAHSSILNPVKFSYLPQCIARDSLVTANGWMNGFTFLSILAGNMIGAHLAPSNAGATFAIAWLMLFVAVAGLAAAWAMPSAPPQRLDPPRWRWWGGEARLLQALRVAASASLKVRAALLGSAWFYLVGAVIITQLPHFTHSVLRADTGVLTFFMALFSVGVAAGSILNHFVAARFSAGPVVLMACALLALSALDVFFSSASFAAGSQGGLADVSQFFSRAEGWRVGADLLGLSLAAGLFVVPLKAIIQGGACDQTRARVLAASAALDAVFIFLSAGVAALWLAAGLGVSALFAALGVCTMGFGLCWWRVLRLGHLWP